MSIRTEYEYQLTGVEDVHGFVTRVCFKTGPPGTVGLESEWFVLDESAPERSIGIPELRALLAGVTPPRGSLITYEPGGQLELSSAAAPDVATLCRDLATDVAGVRTVLAEAGLALSAQGTHPLRTPPVQTIGPRYTAMQTFFARAGVAGEAMMSGTAALQVSLDAGADAADVARRWALTNSLAPVLSAAFANSPLRDGRPTGLASSRAAVWSGIDPSRTTVPTGADPAEAWARYALAARVMLVRTPDGPWIADPGCTFAEWVRGETALPPPTADDLAYHLTTLFPPVRPRGWYEVRYLDALPDGLWEVATAVLTALVEDRAVGDAATEAAASVAGLDDVAARDAVRDPRLRQAAERCLALACAALPRLGAAELVPAVAGFAEHYTARGRCPADDVLDAVRRGRIPYAPAVRCLTRPTGPRSEASQDRTRPDRRHALWP